MAPVAVIVLAAFVVLVALVVLPAAESFASRSKAR